MRRGWGTCGGQRRRGRGQGRGEAQSVEAVWRHAGAGGVASRGLGDDSGDSGEGDSGCDGVGVGAAVGCESRVGMLGGVCGGVVAGVGGGVGLPTSCLARRSSRGGCRLRGRGRVMRRRLWLGGRSRCCRAGTGCGWRCRGEVGLAVEVGCGRLVCEPRGALGISRFVRRRGPNTARTSRALAGATRVVPLVAVLAGMEQIHPRSDGLRPTCRSVVVQRAAGGSTWSAGPLRWLL